MSSEEEGLEACVQQPLGSKFVELYDSNGYVNCVLYLPLIINAHVEKRAKGAWDQQLAEGQTDSRLVLVVEQSFGGMHSVNTYLEYDSMVDANNTLVHLLKALRGCENEHFHNKGGGDQ